MIISKFGNSDNQSLFSSLVNDIFDNVTRLDLVNMKPGRYGIKHLSDDEAFILVKEYETVAQNASGPEFHRKFTDVEFLVYGEEKVGWATVSDEEFHMINQKARFNLNNDIGVISDPGVELNYNVMRPGLFYMFMPRTIHMPCLAVNEPVKVKKVVIRIETALLSDSYNMKRMDPLYCDPICRIN